MKLHIITIGEPKLPYAREGWREYTTRLKRYHSLQLTHIADKHAYDSQYLLGKAGNAYLVAMAIPGKQLDSPSLSRFLDERALAGQELCLIIGGPEGLPQGVLDAARLQWSLSPLTFPHDLAMVITAEALYRASTISQGLPYHK